MYEIIKSFNETTKLAIKENKIYVLKTIFFEDTELYKKLSTLNNANVVKVYETVRIDNDFYAVLEFVQGTTLTDYIKRNGVMDDMRLRDVILQLCSGLEAIHALGIVHRDINPNNVMLDDKGKIKIIDFGISRFQKSNKSADTQILGTQGFAAPEQFGFAQTNVRSDIYSVGVLINYLKTGTLLSEKRDNGAFSSIVIKCTQMDEKNRYKNISELASDISGKNRFKRFIRSIPGFRKGVLWHKITAAVYYLFLLLMIFGHTYQGEYVFRNELFWDSAMIFIFGIPVPLLLNQGDWQSKFSLTKNSTKSNRIFAAAVFSLISVIIGSAFILQVNNP